jgi:hypothetical protein
MSVKLVFRSPEGERIVVLDRPLVVGRDAACDVPIATVRLSRRHAEFEAGPEGVKVRDLGSKNGILVNGVPVEEAVLKPGDRVLLGDVSVSVDTKEAPTRTRVTAPIPVQSPTPMSAVAAPSDLDRTARLPVGGLVSAPLPVAPQPAPAKSSLSARFGLGARVTALCAAAGAVTYLVSVWPGSMVSSAAAAHDAEVRATTVVRLLVAENREPLASGRPLGVAVGSAMQQPGVREAMIIGPQGRVLAPPERLDTTVATLTGLGPAAAIGDLALARVGSEVHVAGAIRSGNQRLGVAWLVFDPSYATDNQRALLLVRLASAAGAVAIGLAVAALISRMFASGLGAFAEDVDLAVAGRQASLTDRYGIPGLARPVEAINFLLQRKPATPPPLDVPRPARDQPQTAAGETAGSAGVVTLDGSFVVRNVDAAAAALLGATPDTLIGRHVLEAANRLVVDIIVDCLADLGSSTSASREATGPVARVTASRDSPAGPITLTLEPKRGA